MHEKLFIPETLSAAWSANLALTPPSSLRLLRGVVEHGANNACLVPAKVLFAHWSATLTSHPHTHPSVAPCAEGVVEWAYRLGRDPSATFGISNFGRYNEEGTQVSPQGGRHRAAALLLLGVDPVPVWFDNAPDDCTVVGADSIEVRVRTDVEAVANAFYAEFYKQLPQKRPWWRVW